MSRGSSAYIDRIVDREAYLSRKKQLLDDRAALISRKASLEAGGGDLREHAEKIIELTKALRNLPDLADDEKLRELLKDTTSNLTAHQKYVVIAWSNPFRALMNERVVTSGEPKRIKPRTFAQKAERVVKAIITHSKALAVDASENTKLGPERKRPNSGAPNIVEFNRRRQSDKGVKVHGFDDIAA